MNTHTQLEYVRNLLSSTHEILMETQKVDESIDSFAIEVMIRPLGGVVYKKTIVEVIVYSKENLTWVQDTFGITLGGLLTRRLQYGLGSWCSHTLNSKYGNFITVLVAKRCLDREQNRGTY